jgi:hypothetical protein
MSGPTDRFCLALRTVVVAAAILALPQVGVARIRGIRFPEDFQSAGLVTRVIVAGYDKDRIRFTKVANSEVLEIEFGPHAAREVGQSWPSAGTDIVVVTGKTGGISLVGERHEAGWLFRDPTLSRRQSVCKGSKDRSLDGCFISDAELAPYLK